MVDSGDDSICTIDCPLNNVDRTSLENVKELTGIAFTGDDGTLGGK